MRLQSTARDIPHGRRAGDTREAAFDRTAGMPDAIDARVVTVLEPDHPDADRARQIRAEIIARWNAEADVEGKQLSVAFVALDDGGKLAEIAANVAVSFAQLERQVLLVDADLRSPAQHGLFCISQAPGLSELLQGQTVAADTLHPTVVPGLRVMPSGNAVATVHDAVERRPLLERMEEERLMRNDVLIVSIGGRSVQALATVLAHFDCVVPVVRRGRTRTRELKSLVTELEERGVQTCGVVVSP